MAILQPPSEEGANLYKTMAPQAVKFLMPDGSITDGFDGANTNNGGISAPNPAPDGIVFKSAATFADLPRPAHDYQGQIYFVTEGSGGLLSAIGVYKYPRGFYSPNDHNEWAPTSLQVAVSEDALTIVNIQDWAAFANIVSNINAKDAVLYDGAFYQNLTGIFTNEPPPADAANWTAFNAANVSPTTPGFVTPVQRTFNRRGLVGGQQYTQQQMADAAADMSRLVDTAEYGDVPMIRTYSAASNIVNTTVPGISTRDGMFKGGFGFVTGGVTVAKTMHSSSLDRGVFRAPCHGRSSTAAATAAKIVSVRSWANNSNVGQHITRSQGWHDVNYGQQFAVSFNALNTAAGNVTLNVNGTGAKPVYKNGALVTGANWAGIMGQNVYNILHYNIDGGFYEHLRQEPFPLVNNAQVGIRFTSANTAANPTVSINDMLPLPLYDGDAQMTGNVFPANKNLVFTFNQSLMRLVFSHEEPVSRIVDGAKIAVATHNSGVDNPTLELNLSEAAYPVYNPDGVTRAALTPNTEYILRFDAGLERWIILETHNADANKHNTLKTMYSANYEIFGSIIARYRFLDNNRTLELLFDYFYNINLQQTGTVWFGRIPEFDFIRRAAQDIWTIYQGTKGRIELDHEGNINFVVTADGSGADFGFLGNSVRIPLQ